jgi:hypothetical protein
MFLVPPHYYLSLFAFPRPRVASCRVVSCPCVEIKIMANNCTSGVRKNLFPVESHSVVLPQVDGKLPIWQIAVAVTAVFNTAQNFFTLHLTERVYNAVPHTQPGISPPHFSLPWV